MAVKFKVDNCKAKHVGKDNIGCPYTVKSFLFPVTTHRAKLMHRVKLGCLGP